MVTVVIVLGLLGLLSWWCYQLHQEQGKAGVEVEALLDAMRRGDKARAAQARAYLRQWDW